MLHSWEIIANRIPFTSWPSLSGFIQQVVKKMIKLIILKVSKTYMNTGKKTQGQRHRDRYKQQRHRNRDKGIETHGQRHRDIDTGTDTNYRNIGIGTKG